MHELRVSAPAVDRLLAVAVTATLIVEVYVLGPDVGQGSADSAAVLVTGALGVSLALRRRAPVVILLLAAATVAVPATGPFDGPIAPLLGIIAATYSAGSETRGRAALTAAAGSLAVVGLGIWRDAGPDQQASDVALPILLFGGPWLVGVATRLFGERAAALDRARSVAAAATIAEERTRIARELHDSVAHAIAVVVVQARGARRALETDRDSAREALDAIETTSTGALAEMRRLVGVLRAEDGGELEPAPGLGQLGPLVARVRAAGLSVEVSVEGTPVSLPPGLDLSAYRIVQEALTNALEHAGGATARVVVRYGDGSIELEISDTGRGPRHAIADGHGLTGMRERVAMLDGAFDAGPAPGGGFTIRARLPLPDVAT